MISSILSSRQYRSVKEFQFQFGNEIPQGIKPQLGRGLNVRGLANAPTPSLPFRPVFPSKYLSFLSELLAQHREPMGYEYLHQNNAANQKEYAKNIGIDWACCEKLSIPTQECTIGDDIQQGRSPLASLFLKAICKYIAFRKGCDFTQVSSHASDLFALGLLLIRFLCLTTFVSFEACYCFKFCFLCFNVKLR